MYCVLQDLYSLIQVCVWKLFIWWRKLNPWGIFKIEVKIYMPLSKYSKYRNWKIYLNALGKKSLLQWATKWKVTFRLTIKAQVFWELIFIRSTPLPILMCGGRALLLSIIFSANGDCVIISTLQTWIGFIASQMSG